MAKKELAKTPELRLDGLMTDIDKLGIETQYLDEPRWMSSGCLLLDLLIGGAPGKGYRLGRFYEFYGKPSSGKSLIGVCAMIQAVKLGGSAFYIVGEGVEKDFLRRLFTNNGADYDKSVKELLPRNMEELLILLERIIAHYKDTNTPVVVFIDSLSSYSSELLGEKHYKSNELMNARQGVDPKLWSTWFTRDSFKIDLTQSNIVLLGSSQVRDTMRTTNFGDTLTTNKGWGIKHHASIRLKMEGTTSYGNFKTMYKSRPDGLKDSDTSELNGIFVVTQCIKNKVGRPFRKRVLSCNFDIGLDDAWTSIQYLRFCKKLGYAGGYFNFNEKRIHITEMYKMMREDADTYNFINEEVWKTWNEQNVGEVY